MELQRSMSIVCEIPDPGESHLNVLWFSPHFQDYEAFSTLKQGCDLYDFFTRESDTQIIRDHLSSGLHIQASYRLELGHMMWCIDCVMHDVIFLTLDPVVGEHRDMKRSDFSSLEDGQQILDLLPNPVFVKDREHRWVLGNQAFWELIGKNALGASDYDLFPKEQADVFWEKDEQVFHSGVAVGNEEQITSRDGSLRWLWTVKTPIKLSDGEQGLVGVIMDITRRKLAEEQLLQNISLRDEALANSRSKSRFLTSMSHELRTPLNAILGYTELLLEEIVDDPVVQESYESDLLKVRSATYHLLDLINDVLDLSRIESGTIHLNPSSINLEKVILECFGTLEGLLKKGQELEYIDESGWSGKSVVTVDKARFQQVLINLLGNAIKFSEQGVIRVRLVRREADVFTLHVSDQGKGVAPEAHAKIFRPFERLSYENSSVLGTGLGLGLARHLCRTMGGEVDIKKVADHDTGATFMISLPCDVLHIENLTPDDPLTPRLQDLHASERRDVIVFANAESGLSELLGLFSRQKSINLLRCTSFEQLKEVIAVKLPWAIIIDEPLQWGESVESVVSRVEGYLEQHRHTSEHELHVWCYEREYGGDADDRFLPCPLTLIDWHKRLDEIAR